DVDAERRKVRFELRDVLASNTQTIFSSVGLGDSGRLAEGRPRGSRLPVGLVTQCEIEERSTGRIQALALGKLRARLAIATSQHEAIGVIEESFGRSIIGGALLRGGRRCEHEYRSEREEGRPAYDERRHRQRPRSGVWYATRTASCIARADG